MTVSENIRIIRKEKGLTQKKLAELCGMNEVQLRQYELGKANPKIETIRRIATALDVTISDLVDDWNMFSKNELMEDLTDYGGGFYGKEAPKEIQEKFTEHLLGRKSEICRKMDLLNETGQDKAIEQVELLTKIPEYQKEPPQG